MYAHCYHIERIWLNNVTVRLSAVENIYLYNIYDGNAYYVHYDGIYGKYILMTLKL